MSHDRDELPFAKLQAAGNVYLAVDGRDRSLDWPGIARAMCRHRLGVGSDGLVVVEASSLAPVRMRVFNSDGSEAEMSGNGIRLFAKFVLDRGLASAEPDEGLAIETGGGVRSVVPELAEDGTLRSARVAMGAPRFAPTDLPVAGPFGDLERLPASVELPVSLGGGMRMLRVTLLSIGNPHAVALLEEPVDGFPLAEVGPHVVEHPWFPNRINFEIVNVLSRTRLRARIYERGEGETESSGTGSTACAIAARQAGHTDASVEVSLRGGSLFVSWPGEGEAWLEGPMEEVFRGRWPLAADQDPAESPGRA